MKKISLAKRKAAGAFLLAALMISGLVFTACGKKTETVTQPAEEVAETADPRRKALRKQEVHKRQEAQRKAGPLTWHRRKSPWQYPEPMTELLWMRP